jgi:hypothetical protein
MECSDIFVEVDREEVQRPLSRPAGVCVLLNSVVVVVRRFSSKGAHLFVAASVPRNEEDWYALDLEAVSTVSSYTEDGSVP